MRTSRVVFFDILKYLRFNAANLLIAECTTALRWSVTSLCCCRCLALEMSYDARSYAK